MARGEASELCLIAWWYQNHRPKNSLKLKMPKNNRVKFDAKFKTIRFQSLSSKHVLICREITQLIKYQSILRRNHHSNFIRGVHNIEMSKDYIILFLFSLFCRKEIRYRSIRHAIVGAAVNWITSTWDNVVMYHEFC